MIKVLKSGLYTSVQDLGRFGQASFGVPMSGVMDMQSAKFANVLLGNPEHAAVLEITMVGPELEFTEATSICIVGAEMSPKVNGAAVKNNMAINVFKGDRLTFGRLQKGMRCYLAVLGGVQTESVLGSRSMYWPVTLQSRLEKGDELKLVEMKKHSLERHAVVRFDDSYVVSETLEVFEGPEFNELSKEQQTILFSKTFTISNHNSRMAYQLNETLQNSLNAIITAPVLPGTVQLTPSGQLIVLMRDCQTTGGYPRVLQLTEASINSLAQKTTGNTIRFRLKPWNLNR
ncbi:biotin-dependent carboxyltransferase family protein [Mangrovimonas sp. YM274]|uniref:5-oxoprolinase subunit C family protein n=1 Tax=Mangrovimonas sp. YM274 TaxID=3070660 RepID=UPI0027DB1F4B|nr:biotin-dependent carboxyltransferase family protein [Mangrovimonas sp. YM274]WMI67540.1 biotin-dependent carboxyltransferase family protein [Mangrovimonas sp. YM274]